MLIYDISADEEKELMAADLELSPLIEEDLCHVIAKIESLRELLLQTNDRIASVLGEMENLSQKEVSSNEKLNVFIEQLQAKKDERGDILAAAAR